MIASLIGNLRPLLHPMLVHFPIALLFASVALDWIELWLNHPGPTRAGFYTLVLGALGAALAALSGPDHVTGTAVVSSLFISHQNFALLTVALAVSLVIVRFFAVDGITGAWALGYLAGTLALLTVVSLTGYYGGDLVYHQAIGVTLPAGVSLTTGGSFGRPLLPVKPLVALIGLLCVVGLGLWLAAGSALALRYYTAWRRAVRQDRTTGGAIWTLHLRSAQPECAFRGMAAQPLSTRSGQPSSEQARSAPPSGGRG